MGVRVGGTTVTSPPLFINLYVKCQFSAYMLTLFACEGAIECVVHPPPLLDCSLYFRVALISLYFSVTFEIHLACNVLLSG